MPEISIYAAPMAAMIYLGVRFGLDFGEPDSPLWKSPRPYVTAAAVGMLVIALIAFVNVILALDGSQGRFAPQALRPGSGALRWDVIVAHLHPWLAAGSSLMFYLAARKWDDVLWSVRVLVSHRLTRHGVCVACRYPLEGLKEPICPECGNSHEHTRAPPEFRSLVRALPLAWFCLAVLGSIATIATSSLA